MVDRQTKLLLESLTGCVDQREALVEKAAVHATAKQIKGPPPQMTKSLVNKKVTDLKMKLRKLRKEELELKKELQVLCACMCRYSELLSYKIHFS